MGLGALSLVSLAVARDMTLECRRQVLGGLDPLVECLQIKRARQLEQARSITFQEAAEQCIASKKPEWKNAKHAQQWANSLTTYAYPVFGNLSVSDLDTDLVLKAIVGNPRFMAGPSALSEPDLRDQLATLIQITPP
jgi:hypothetical protein